MAQTINRHEGKDTFSRIEITSTGGLEGADILQSSAIEASAITAAKLATSAVETAKIKTANVTAAKLATSAVESAKIKSAAVTTAKIAAGAVASSHVATSAIIAAKIGSGAVTAVKLGTSAVETAKIKAANVTSAKIAAGNVLSSHVATSAVSVTKIGLRAVTATKVANAVAGNAEPGILVVHDITLSNSTATSGVTTLAPTHRIQVLDASFLKTGGSATASTGSPTVTLGSSAGSISNALAMKQADKAIVRAGTIDDAYHIVAAGASITVTRAGMSVASSVVNNAGIFRITAVKRST